MANSSLPPNLNAPTLPPRYPGIATAVANHLARKEIERQWRAQGRRITRYATIVAEAQTYLRDHPELFEQALSVVRRSPWHSMMAQREERERQRVERKREREWRKLVVVDDLPVRTNAQWAGMMVSPTLLSMLSEGGLAQSAGVWRASLRQS